MSNHRIPPHPNQSPTEPKRNVTAWRLTGGRCWYCGCALDPDRFHMDHVIPRSTTGLGLRGNKVIACPSCNSAKRNRSLDEFRAMRQRQRDGVPYFGPEQREWLKANGFIFPDSESFVFWFEEMGLAL